MFGWKRRLGTPSFAMKPLSGADSLSPSIIWQLLKVSQPEESFYAHDNIASSRLGCWEPQKRPTMPSLIGHSNIVVTKNYDSSPIIEGPQASVDAAHRACRLSCSGPSWAPQSNPRSYSRIIWINSHVVDGL
jgi:hypothetical protein